MLLLSTLLGSQCTLLDTHTQRHAAALAHGRLANPLHRPGRGPLHLRGGLGNVSRARAAVLYVARLRLPNVLVTLGNPASAVLLLLAEGVRLTRTSQFVSQLLPRSVKGTRTIVRVIPTGIRSGGPSQYNMSEL